jgi:MinD-like ATPase involved in chromosome partitioning or flagellar assembly
MKINQEKGKIITFYSFKGGVGRSMALANIACLLTQDVDKIEPKKVLIIDWDLDAPGLHSFFSNSDINSSNKGLIDLFENIQQKIDDTLEKTDSEDLTEDYQIKEILDSINLTEYLSESGINHLDILTCGKIDNEYSRRVTSFEWQDLFNKAPNLFRIFAEYLVEQYQYVLIDSRTGHTDISGICTMLMSEILVLVFIPNSQNISGVVDLLYKATDYRKQSDDLRPLVAFPVPSRIEDGEDKLKHYWWKGNQEKGIKGYQPEFEKAFNEIYSLGHHSLDIYFDKVQIPYVPYYAYGEEIAVLREDKNNVRSLAASYDRFKKRLTELDAPWELFEYEVEDTFIEKYGQNAEQDLVKQFLPLPFHRKIEIAKDLGLYIEDDLESKDSILVKNIIERAKEQELMIKLWDLTFKGHPKQVIK